MKKSNNILQVTVSLFYRKRWISAILAILVVIVALILVKNQLVTENIDNVTDSEINIVSSERNANARASLVTKVSIREQRIIWRLSEASSKQLHGRLGELAKKDLHLALKYAESIEDNKASREAVLAVLWASLSIGEDFLIDTLPYIKIPESDRAALVAQLVTQWSDPSAAFEWVDNNVKGSTRGEMLGRCLSKLAINSPEEAISILNQMGKGGERSAAGTFMFSSWASNSPIQALSVAGKVSDKVEKNLLLEIAHAALVRLEPKKAELILENWCDNIGNNSISQKSAITLASHLALSKIRGEGPAHALTWAQSLPIELKVGASRVILDNWGQRYPYEAANAFKKLDTKQRVMLGESFMSGWAQRGPADAGNWLLSYPESRERVDMTASLVSIWGNADPESAYTWLGTLNVGQSRDAGIQRLIVRERPGNPEAALTWAFEISDPKVRDAEVKILQDNYFDDPN